MKFLRVFSTILIVMFIQACSSPATITTLSKSPPGYFVDLKNYAWHEASGMKKQEEIEKQFKPTITMAIDKELQAKGYGIDAASPDFLVNFSITKGVRTKTHYRTNWDNYSPDFKWNRKEGLKGPSSHASASAGSYVENIESGTLIINITHPDNNQLLWRAIAQKDLNSNISDERARRDITEAVIRALEDFPVH